MFIKEKFMVMIVDFIMKDLFVVHICILEKGAKFI